MRHYIALLFVLLCRLAVLAQPICQITRYDEFTGMSQCLVKQVVQDSTGMMWFATWNGLNRFDGYRFDVVKPRVGDGSGVYSDRINDIKPSTAGFLWCRIDGRCLIFDVSTHRFVNFLSDIEKRLKRRFEVTRIRTTDDGRLVMDCSGGVYLTVSDSDPVGTARASTHEPAVKYRKADNIKADVSGHFAVADLIYSCTDNYGTTWVVTRGGEIHYSEAGVTQFRRYPERIDVPVPLYYSMTDSQGNVWLRSNYGAFRLVFGRHPYTAPHHEGSTVQLRCVFRDSRGRLWKAGLDDKSLRVEDAGGRLVGYLGAGGRLSSAYVSFGHPVYCMTEDRRGRIWVGTKPDGLFILDELPSGAFDVKEYRRCAAGAGSPANIYDLCTDSRGRIWMATMPDGVWCTENPEADVPVFANASGAFSRYPSEAMSVRRVFFTKSGTMLLATTGGLVAADVRSKDLRDITFRLHTGESGRASSLSNVAVMDVLEDSRGRVFVATESGGVNLVLSSDLLSERLDFRHFDTSSALSSDIAISLAEHGGRLWIVSNNSLMSLDADSGESVTYDAFYWKRRLRFSECRPFCLDGGGRWLFGVHDGGIVLNLDSMGHRRYVPRIAITAVSIDNGRDSLAVNGMDTLVMQPDERNVTVKFAALDYADASEISYAFRLDDDEWNVVGKTRSVTLLDMKPGTFRLMIRSTDSSGRWLDNVRVLTIVVKPVFWETGWARALYLIVILAVVYGVMRTVNYIRSIKRKQREILAAYLRLLDGHAETVKTGDTPTEPEKPAEASLSEEDEQFMSRIMEFVERHIGDSDVNINDMAEAAAISRSGLNRKMKSIVGVTPAEFLRETRLRRAATLLATTERPINLIAIECGFADQNYFGKCFKARNGVTPSDYRRRSE